MRQVGTSPDAWTRTFCRPNPLERPKVRQVGLTAAAVSKILLHAAAVGTATATSFERKHRMVTTLKHFQVGQSVTLEALEFGYQVTLTPGAYTKIPE